LDAEFPYAQPYPPGPPDGGPAPEGPPPVPAPPREPAWSGIELAVIVVLTVAAIVAISLIAVLVWAIVAQATGWSAAGMPELHLVALTLVGQSGGLLAGFLLAWLWIERAGETPFWRAIHWRWLKPETALGMLAGGAAMMVFVQLLGHVLPMPSGVPMDRLFTPHTAWLLLIYGVAIAPFFEEFFFRGLLYPTLRSTFQVGVTEPELHPWRPLVRVVAVAGATGALYWRWRSHLLGQPSSLGLDIGLIVCLVLLAWPQPLIRGIATLVNWMATWRQAELLSILITGLLFGLLHAAQLGWAWAAVLILVIVGVVLTWVRAATGSLVASWIFHCAYNGTLFAAQYIATQGFQHFTQGPH
jgi:membrane protease YdiL (CAAX protease family)